MSQFILFSFRYVPSNKATETPTNGNVRQSQIVAQQLFTLKTTINHLKNAYNGNDVEWPDNGEWREIIIEEKCNLRKKIFFSITDDSDEPEPEGSGSGSGIDDSDDEDGSGEFLIKLKNERKIKIKIKFAGFNSYPDPEQPITPPHPHNPIDTSPGTRHNIHEVTQNNVDEDRRKGSDSDEDVRPPPIETNEVETRSSSSSLSSTTWKQKRLIISYFLPIVMAWFGGSINSAIVELL
jgi:hypothetical protein